MKQKNPSLVEFVEKEFPVLADVLGHNWLGTFFVDVEKLLDQYPSENLEGILCDKLPELPSVNNSLRDMVVDLYCHQHRSGPWVGDGGWVLPLLEQSLQRLSKTAKVKSIYENDLRVKTGFSGAFYEVVCCAKLANLGESFRLHVPNGKRNFDIQIIRGKTYINADIKWRHPNWPATYHDIEKLNNKELISEPRATIHPDFREVESQKYLPRGTVHPESDKIRSILNGAISQLPDNGLNLIILCTSGTPLSSCRHTENALFGDSYLELSTRCPEEKTRRHSNGLIKETMFKKISAVVCVKLSSGKIKSSVYANPNAKERLSDELKIFLESALVIQGQQTQNKATLHSNK